MLVPKKNRLIIYSYLFKEGVIVAPKDAFLPKHPHLEVPNLHVMKLLQSLCSRGYVKEQFNWRWYYYTLTNTGIDYLREYLHLGSEVQPATLKKSEKAQEAPSFKSKTRFGGEIRPRSDRDDYRKKDGAPRDFNPEFGRRGRGGFRGGRGRGGRGGFRGEQQEAAPAQAPAPAQPVA